MRRIRALLDSYFKFVKKFLPDMNPAGVVGIEVSPTYCRAVDLVMKGGVLELRSWATVPVENGDEKTALAQTIAALAPADRSRPVVVSVSGKGTLVRNVEMPRMSPSELKKAFAIEADKYFPFPKETVYNDCHIFDPQGADKKMSVLIAAVKKEIVDARIKALNESGIEPAAVTMSGIAVANTFVMHPPALLSQANGGKGAVAVIDIGMTSSNLMIFVDRSPRFSRDIFVGLSDFIKRIANVSGCSTADAQGQLYSDQPRPEVAQKAIEASVANLVSELRLSFDYFTTEKNTPISQLYLIGEGVAVPGIESMITDSFDIPLFVWNPLEKLALKGKVSPEEVAKDGRRYVVALGLALNEYDTV